MPKKIIVNKFGGGLMIKKYIPLIRRRLREQLKNGYRPVVVVSALKGVTDKILEFLSELEKSGAFKKKVSSAIKRFTADLFNEHLKIMAEVGLKPAGQQRINYKLKELFSLLENDLAAYGRRPRPALKARLSAYGEKFSAVLLVAYLNASGFRAKEFLAEDLPIITDNNYNNADIEYKISEKNARQKLLAANYLPVVAGFTGKSAKGETTVLGRGGTDTTACFLAAALRAVRGILWKDVGGVLSADPKIAPRAKTIPFISYQEAEESGKVIHEKASQYAKLFKTPAAIISLTEPKHKTEIGPERRLEKGAKIVSFKKDLFLFIINEEAIGMNNLLALAGAAFSRHKVAIVLISNARYILQIVADNGNGQVDKVFKELKSKVSAIKFFKVSMVFLVGSFKINDVNKFNDLLIRHKTGMEISAFLYENCSRIEAIIKTDKLENIIRVLYKEFIKK